MPFLRNDNFLGSFNAGRNMEFLASQQWRDGTGCTGLVAQLGLAGIRSPRLLDRQASREPGRRGDTVNGRYSHLCGLDYSFVLDRK